MNNLLQRHEEGKEIELTEITSVVDIILEKSCSSSFGKRNPKPKGTDKKKTFYTKKFKDMKSAYYKTKREYKKTHLHNDYKTLIEKSRAVKQEVKKAKQEAHKSFTEKLRTLQSKNPKEYWRLIHNKSRETTEASRDDLLEHFRELSTVMDNKDLGDLSQVPVIDNKNLNTNILNQAITEDEVTKAAKKLKNGKSSGIDGIKNEHIKHSIDTLMPLYLLLFNKVLDNGELPEEWGTGLIVPIYKKKGDKKDPNNYRGITLLSCLGKLFTSIINNRLTKYAYRTEKNFYEIIKVIV